LYHFEAYGIEISYEKALKYLKSIADQGNRVCLYYLGVYFEKGLGGLEKSYEQAFKYFKKAADQGHKKARYATAKCYHEGRGVKQSEEEAFKYYKLAADQGDAISQYHTGRYFESLATKSSTDLEFKEMLAKAIEYYTLALKQDCR